MFVLTRGDDLDRVVGQSGLDEVDEQVRQFQRFRAHGVDVRSGGDVESDFGHRHRQDALRAGEESADPVGGCVLR